MKPIICPRCKGHHGNDWSQCGGICPMKMSPFYNPTLAANITKTALELLNGRKYLIPRNEDLIPF